MAYPGTNDMLRRFNRDDWLAAGLLGAVVFTALAFAVLVPERHPKTTDLTKEGSQAKSDAVLNADSATPFRIVDLNTKRSTSEVTSETATNVDGITEISSKENLAPTKAGAVSTPAPVRVLSPEISRAITRANANEWSPAHRQNSARLTRVKIPHERYRWAGRLRAVDVKMRLIALWHRLLRSENLRIEESRLYRREEP